VIASCKGMKDSGIGWPPNFTSNSICCSAFTDQNLLVHGHDVK
jgi:hypothetical protein